jgi:hypothetical protein
MSEGEQIGDDDDYLAAAMGRPIEGVPTLSTFEAMSVDVRNSALSGFTCDVTGHGPFRETRSPGDGAGRYDVVSITLERTAASVVDRMVRDVVRRYQGIGARLLLSGDLRVDICRVSAPPLRVADLRTHPILYRANPCPERLAKVGSASPEWDLVRILTDILAVAAIELPGQSGPDGRDYLIRTAHSREFTVEPIGALHEIAPMLADSSASAVLASLLDLVRRLRRT